MKKRIFIVLAVAVFGFMNGGFFGLFAALMLFGIFSFLFYTMKDATQRVGNFMRPKQTVVVVKDGEAKPGHPDIEGTASKHPDPTRPDVDDFMGLITYRIEKGRHHG